MRGKRRQAALKEMLQALDARPEKRLIAEDLEDSSGNVCALGALGKARGIVIPRHLYPTKAWPLAKLEQHPCVPMLVSDATNPHTKPARSRLAKAIVAVVQHVARNPALYVGPRPFESIHDMPPDDNAGALLDELIKLKIFAVETRDFTAIACACGVGGCRAGAGQSEARKPDGIGAGGDRRADQRAGEAPRRQRVGAARADHNRIRGKRLIISVRIRSPKGSGDQTR
jgi:hypothetical protein